MAEPQPAGVVEGLDPTANESEVPEPAGGDSRKAAAALSSLTSRTDDDTKASSAPSAADRQALGEAMSRLEGLELGSELGSKAGNLPSNLSPEKEKREREAEERRKVKVDATDVALLVEELELSKVKATELLKSHGGDAVKALTAYVTGVA